MRLLAVVPRYGAGVSGGAESLCREQCERLAARGHGVEVATTCAVSYVDWADALEPGTTEEQGVTVHRHRVRRPRDRALFDGLHDRVVWGRRRGHAGPSLAVQEAWMRAQGPDCPDLVRFVAEESGRFDAVAFLPYLYASTWAAIGATRAPALLQPLAHDEPPWRLPLFDGVLRRPDGFGFVTPEEEALVRRRVPVGDRPAAVVGIGTDPVPPADPDLFRRVSGLGDRPYVVVVGRVDPSKGTTEAARLFAAYKERNPGSLALALVGDPVAPPPAIADVVVCGLVDEDTKRSALAGAVCLLQPSYFESFSIVLLEAWAQGRPVLVNGRCDVLRGQAARARGGLAYAGFPEFEAALDLLVGDEALAARLGAAGRAHAEANHGWGTVLDRYEHLVEAVSST
ncbi:MAG TPA: glycosyltransferase family 4 protein [Acidimicrobiales bacterium]|nr:glycosyltransferase family 4 protein [Acidimicrobiales bacterium]